jgi:hypothetical protein
MRQIFICAPMSNKIEMTITNPKLESNCLVKTVVWVRKPGPIADVAIKKAAPVIAEVWLVFFKINLFKLYAHSRFQAIYIEHEYVDGVEIRLSV